MKEGSALGHQLCFDPYYSQPILIQLLFLSNTQMVVIFLSV